LIKEGKGALSFGGMNTLRDGMTVNAGTLILAEGSQTVFTIGAGGTSGRLAGAGTVMMNGAFVFDLTNAGSKPGDRWIIVDVSALKAEFGQTFSVAGFANNGDHTWSKQNGGLVYTFDESTGVLSAAKATVATVGFMPLFPFRIR
jgi:hypothetical protein